MFTNQLVSKHHTHQTSFFQYIFYDIHMHNYEKEPLLLFGKRGSDFDWFILRVKLKH